MKRFFVGLVEILISVSILCSCHQNVESRVEEVQQDEEKQEEKPVLVFSIGNSSILSDFQTENTDQNIEIVVIDQSNVEKDFEDSIYDKGMPDIIIDSGNERGLDFWLEKGYCEDISTYVDTDTSFDSDKYYPGVMSVGQVDNQIVALPLGLSIDYLTVREEIYDNSGLHYLEENYSAEELLSTLDQELDYQNRIFNEGNGELIYQVFSDWNGDFVFLLWDYGALSVSNGEITLDKELFNLICRVYEKHCWNFSYANQQGTAPMNTKTSPLDKGARYIATTWFNSGINKGVAPQVAISYAESINKEVFGQETKVIWMPMKSETNEEPEYAARVSFWGMVGSQSERKEEAYQILRDMMDLELSAYSRVDGQQEIPFSVNREKSLAMITMVDESSIKSYTISDEEGESSTITKHSLSLENRAQLEYVLENITNIYTVDMDLQDQIFDIVYPYVQGGVGHYDECYDLVLELLQKEMIE